MFILKRIRRTHDKYHMFLPIKMQVPESFYEAEERSGHLITKKEKKIWAVELDLIEEFRRVCTKYNLRWFVAYGTLLGAVRHNGFIPWDNDVDVWMPREDFKILCKHSNEFLHPYFLQTPQTEKGRYFSNSAKLCNSLTTGSWKGLYDLGINCGLFIDIFILDEIPDSKEKERSVLKKIFFYSRFEFFINRKNKHKLSFKQYVRYLIWIFYFHKCDGAVLFDLIGEICDKCNGRGYGRMGYFPSLYGERDRFPKECLSETQWVDFEILKVPVPIGFHTILSNVYGNYMQLPPIDKRCAHDYLDISPDIPYNEYWKS